LPGWLRIWLFIVALAAGAILLVASLTIVALVLAVALLPVVLWMWLTGRLRRERGGVIEGSAKRVDEETPTLGRSRDDR
jgi:membrane protein implicated in regulation of membrane protease activity